MEKSEKIKLAKSVLSEIQTTANIMARANGMGTATKIVKGKKLAIIDWTNSGYRKNTTDEYVPNSYRSNFGWKNTYYQKAECIVSIPPVLWKNVEKWESFLNTNN